MAAQQPQQGGTDQLIQALLASKAQKEEPSGDEEMLNLLMALLPALMGDEGDTESVDGDVDAAGTEDTSADVAQDEVAVEE